MGFVHSKIGTSNQPGSLQLSITAKKTDIITISTRNSFSWCTNYDLPYPLPISLESTFDVDLRALDSASAAKWASHFAIFVLLKLFKLALDFFENENIQIQVYSS